MTVRQGPRSYLVAGDDAHRILECLKPFTAVPHDCLELQDLALQRQHTGRQVLLPERLDAGRRSRLGGLVELIFGSCRQRYQQCHEQDDKSCGHGIPPSICRRPDLRRFGYRLAPNQ
jgi:hypothetical protein